MTDRQFLWGLSNGVVVLALAGTFWLGTGFGPHLGETGWEIAALFTVLLYGTCALIIWLSVQLKRRAGFKRSDLKQGDERQQGVARKIMVEFRRIGIIQTVLVAVAVFACVRLSREDLVWPSIGLIVSLHFIPLGGIFHVRAYAFLGITGSIVSLVGFFPLFGTYKVMVFCATMGALLWLTAFYLLWRSDQIAAKAMSEPWAV